MTIVSVTVHRLRRIEIVRAVSLLVDISSLLSAYNIFVSLYSVLIFLKRRNKFSKNLVFTLVIYQRVWINFLIPHEFYSALQIKKMFIVFF